MAVTRPMAYPSLMTTLKAKCLIAAVWVVSFVICFPPLVGWNDKHRNFFAEGDNCALNCELTNEVGYVVYSAMGSFFLPMLVMLFFYWKIYCAAAETTKAINRGFRTTKDRKHQFDEEKVTLRIHVGRNNSLHGHDRQNQSKPKVTATRSGPPGKPKFSSEASKYRVPSRYNIYESSRNQGPREGLELVSLHNNKPKQSRIARRQLSTPILGSQYSFRSSQSSSHSQTKEGECNNGAAGAPKPKSLSKMSRRNIKVQVKMFKMETKAAKTLGIIVGVFILCWFPFFTMYLVRGFCKDCIHHLLFSILFWLGYCNSAINPCIYALFSKDFRFAFKKILCKCVCTRETKVAWPLPHPSLYAPSYDDSDENFEEVRAT